MKISFKAIIDRFEGNTAILLIGDDDSITINSKFLPEGSKEGDMVQMDIKKKDKKTAVQKEKVEKLIKKLSL